MPLTVKIAGPPDLHELIAVARATYVETYDAMGEKPAGIARLYADRTFVPEKLRPGLEHPDGSAPFTYLIARDDGQPAGYAALENVPGPDCLPNRNAICFAGVFVLKQFRGRGLGQLLFARRRALARERGYTGAWLAVWEQNRDAIRFHESLGFKTVGRQSWTFAADGQRWDCDDRVMYRDL